MPNPSRDKAQVLSPKNLKLPFWLFNFEELVEHLAVFVDHQVDEIVRVELVDPETECVDGFRGE